jgi:hypothetical protein
MRRFIFFKGLTKEWVTTQVVGGEVRTLRAVWSPELAEDLNDVYSIDAVAELSRLLSDEIDNNIMREIRDMVTEEEITEQGLDIFNDDGDEIETTSMIRELSRLINGGNRA